MRLPNQFGSVSKLSGKRRKPYMAKKYAGKRWDEEKGREIYLYTVIGCFATKSEAMRALNEAQNQAVLKKSRKTFRDVYEEWADSKYPTISKSMASDYKGAFKKCHAIHDKVFSELTAYDLEAVCKDPEVPRTSVHRMKVLFSQLYQHAMRHDIVTRNVAELINVVDDRESQVVHRLFDAREVHELKARAGDTLVDMVLVSLYTGMRPSEVCKLTAESIDLGRNTITGGSKTKAGKDRVIPIHREIREIISSRASGGGALFRNELGQPVIYKTYREWFNDRFQGKHIPYDTRHTFASNWHTSGEGGYPLDPLIEKLIMGHSVGDITKGVYTHLSRDRMSEEMQKYHIN